MNQLRSNNLRLWGWSTACAVVLALVACGKAATTGGTPDGGGTGTGDGGGGSTTSGEGTGVEIGLDGDGGLLPIFDVPGGGTVVDAGALGACIPGPTQCTNCVDDDGDGLADWLDPECSGPLDNDESTFATGIPGDNVDPCRQDCFFDGNSGAGDDKCDRNLKCDPLSPGAPKCPYDANYKGCSTQNNTCVKTCGALVPNGCDCFGCCSLPLSGGGTVDVILTATCSVDKAGDATACPRCTKDVSCNNPCETCELCVGKTTLPAECSTGTTGGTTSGTTSGSSGGSTGGSTLPSCPTGQQACDANNPCGAGYYCLTGCCLATIR